MPGALLVLDRHYTSLRSYDPRQPSLYATRCRQKVLIRFLSYENGLLILRPWQLKYPIITIEIHNEVSPSDYILGRVVLVVNPIE